MTCQSNSSQGRGHDHIPKVTFAKWRIVRCNQATCSLTNHSEVMLSVLTNHRLRNAVTLLWHQWRPCWERNFFTLSVSSHWLISAGPVGFTSHSTKNKSFHRCCSQTISWLRKQNQNQKKQPQIYNKPRLTGVTKFTTMQNDHASGTQKYFQLKINWNNLKVQVWLPLTTSGLQTERAYSQRKR